MTRTDETEETPAYLCSGRQALYRLLPFAFLAIAEFVIFFRHPGHFFNGDSLFWLGNRYLSFKSFLAGFTSVDPALWYRPLSQRTVESLLFPVYGLNPLPYRITGFILFFSSTLAVFMLAKRVTESTRTAWFSAFLFMPHLIHAYVTYDVAFTPELMLTLFYIGAALSYISYLQSRKKPVLILSVLLFVGGLLSKESAVGLPFTLLAVWILLPREKRGSLFSLSLHFLILGIYLTFAFGYLHVRNIQLEEVFRWVPRDPQAEYSYGLGNNVLKNIDVAFSWAFGMPRGMHGQWLLAARWMEPFLKILRALAVLGGLVVLLNRRRNPVLLGIAWFVTAGGAAFLLVGHFLPYYLFLPLAGLALAGGTILDYFYVQCSRLARPLSVAISVMVLGSWLWIHAQAANWLAATHSLMGGAAENSGIVLNDVRSMYPVLPKGVQILLFNEDLPSAPNDSIRGLPFRLAYDDPALVTNYSTEGISVSAETLNSGRVLSFKWDGRHLTDMTPIVRQRPDLLLPHPSKTNYHIELPAVGGMDERQEIRVPELPDTVVEMLYAIDGRVEEPVQVHTGMEGRFKFTPNSPGTCTFVAVRRSGDPAWVTVSGSLAR